MSYLDIVKGWHGRGYLPHFDGGEVPQSLTFRLAGSLPAERIQAWREELSMLPEVEAEREYRSRVETYLDLGHGNTWLADRPIAELVEVSIRHFHGERYELHAWVIMPNHVHVLCTPREGCSLSRIVHGWKSYTGLRANQMLAKDGTFWQEEYFDRYVRSEQHFTATVEYIEQNPVKAGLCACPKDWPYGSARFRGRNGNEQ